MLAQLKDFIKTLEIGEYFSIGKIDSTKDKSIGVYGDSNTYRVEAIGREASYDVADVRILVHWNKNLRETEDAARSLYEQLRYRVDFDISDIHINYIDLTCGEPIYVGTDTEGIYEYVITMRILYRR